MARACPEDAGKKALTNASTVADVVKVTGYDARMKALINEFDREPMLLNTQDGVVDLRDGSMRPHKYDYYFSQITSCGVGGECFHQRKVALAVILGLGLTHGRLAKNIRRERQRTLPHLTKQRDGMLGVVREDKRLRHPRHTAAGRESR